MTSQRFFLLLPLLVTCKPKEESDAPIETCDPSEDWALAPALIPGPPQAGVAEDFLDLPVGVPLSGYTSRCLGQDGRVDYRDSPYAYAFTKSAGVQTRIPIKAFWLTNGDQDLLVLKTDVIYSFDGLVEDIAEQLSTELGRDMMGKVVVATNHSHSSYGDFSDQVTYYLGSDRFNYEIYLRVLEKAVQTAKSAYESKQDAKIGVGFAKDWDPENKVYRDRRGDNDDLQFFEDIPAGSYKDPNLTVIRIDSLDDKPIGVLFDFGLHGTTLDGDNAMISVDSPGHIETVLQERFDTPVVVALLQGGAGDASPASDGSGYGVMERVGEYASDGIMALWESIPTSADPIRLETASRAVPETPKDIRVTRGGAIDLYYTPYDEELVPDNIVYNDDGSIKSPIDEFNVLYGAAFCGEDPPYLPGYAPADVFPYNACVNVSQMISVINGFFDLTDEEKTLPLAESTRAYVTATRLGPVPIREADGTTTTDDFFIGFFPGETTAMYTEQFRRRAKAELGYQHSMAVGYAQDHEGYLLIPEDWLQGGYEADINIWGPLQGEHIMEQLLVMAGEVLSTDVIESRDPCGTWQIPDYGESTLPTAKPDTSPEAGTLLAANPGYLYSPLYSEEELELGSPAVGPVASVARVQGMVEIAWIGGDPGVDLPLVTLEYQQEDGSWEAVTQPSGRTVTGGPDILLTWTPDPLAPADIEQTHYWYAAWQAVGTQDNKVGLSLGMYRFSVEGQSYTGAAATWPWDTAPYQVLSEPFELTPAAITLGVEGTDIVASIQTGLRGYRLLGMDFASDGGVKLEGSSVTLQITTPDGTDADISVELDNSGGLSRLTGVLEGLETGSTVTVIDIYGNLGTLTL